jgi:hypothetical protein
MKKVYKILSTKAKAAFRKGTVGILCIVMTALFIMSAECTKKEKENEPVEIPFTEYSLGETDCSWQNLNHDNKVIIINSKTELETYITCTEGTFPDIDFSKHTLLLASGGGGDIRRTDVYLSQKFKDKYELKITLHVGITAVALKWKAAVIIPKISSNARITVDVEETYN